MNPPRCAITSRLGSRDQDEQEDGSEQYPDDQARGGMIDIAVLPGGRGEQAEARP